MRHLQPRQFRSRLRTGQGVARVRVAACFGGLRRPDAHRGHDVPAALRRAAATGVTRALRPEVRATPVATGATFSHYSAAAVTGFTSQVLPDHGAARAAAVRPANQAHGHLRPVIAAHHVLPVSGWRVHPRFGPAVPRRRI